MEYRIYLKKIDFYFILKYFIIIKMFEQKIKKEQKDNNLEYNSKNNKDVPMFIKLSIFFINNN